MITKLTEDLIAIEVGAEYSDFFISGLRWLCAYKPYRQPFELLSEGDNIIIGVFKRDLDNSEMNAEEELYRALLASKGCILTYRESFVIVKIDR